MCKTRGSFVLVSLLLGSFPVASRADLDLKEAANIASSDGRKVALEAFKASLQFSTRNPTGVLKGILSDTDPGKDLEVVLTSLVIDDPQRPASATAKLVASGPVRLNLGVVEPRMEITAEGSLSLLITLKLHQGSITSASLDRAVVHAIEVRKVVLVVTEQAPKELNADQRARLIKLIDIAVSVAFQQNTAGLLERMNKVLKEGRDAGK